MIRLGDRRAGSGASDDGTDESAGSPTEHGSPGLEAIAASLGPDAGCRVLDLGPAVPANITFYGGFANHVRVVDAVQELADHVEIEGDDGGFDGLLDEIWRGVQGDFDVAMAWDLISHVDRQLARAVIARLHVVCRPGARLFLMTYAGSVMPSRPQVFEIRSASRLLYRPVSAGLVPSRQIPPAEVDRLLRGFQVEYSYLLRHGIREYVAIRV